VPSREQPSGVKFQMGRPFVLPILLLIYVIVTIATYKSVGLIRESRQVLHASVYPVFDVRGHIFIVGTRVNEKLLLPLCQSVQSVVRDLSKWLRTGCNSIRDYENNAVHIGWLPRIVGTFRESHVLMVSKPGTEKLCWTPSPVGESNSRCGDFSFYPSLNSNGNADPRPLALHCKPVSFLSLGGLFLHFFKRVVHRVFLQTGDIGVYSSGHKSGSGGPKEPPLNPQRFPLETLCFLIISIALHYKSIEAISDVRKNTNRFWYVIFTLRYATFLFITQ